MDPGAPVGLGSGELDTCFPFHFVVDASLRVVATGSVLARLLPEVLDRPGLGATFEPLRMGADLSFASLSSCPRATVMLRSKRRPALVLRGQLVPATGDRLVFVGGPRLSVDGLRELGLSLDDFAAHDPMADFLFLVHAQQASLAEAARLSAELERLNGELESRVRARTAELEAANAQLVRTASDLSETLVDLGRTNDSLRREKLERERVEEELRISHRLEAVGQLAAGIAHEINTPIQYMGDSVYFLHGALADLMPLVGRLGHIAEVLRSVGLPHEASLIETTWQEIDGTFLQAQIPRAFERVLDGIERVSGIVRAMKTFAHPGSEERAPANLNDALTNTLVVARNELKYVADVETDLGDLPLVACHLGEINQVFLNLVVNAAHAVAEAVEGTDRRGRISVRSRNDGDAVIVEVTDDGVGIRSEVKERVFDPFFTTKPVGKGTGQGLAMARSIVAKHGGQLAFESTPGIRTTFTLRLPLTAAPGQGASA